MFSVFTGTQPPQPGTDQPHDPLSDLPQHPAGDLMPQHRPPEPGSKFVNYVSI